jgi:hypothetical protein
MANLEEACRRVPQTRQILVLHDLDAELAADE